MMGQTPESRRISHQQAQAPPLGGRVCEGPFGAGRLIADGEQPYQLPEIRQTGLRDVGNLEACDGLSTAVVSRPAATGLKGERRHARRFVGHDRETPHFTLLTRDPLESRSFTTGLKQILWKEKSAVRGSARRHGLSCRCEYLEQFRASLSRGPAISQCSPPSPADRSLPGELVVFGFQSVIPEPFRRKGPSGRDFGRPGPPEIR